MSTLLLYYFPQSVENITFVSQGPHSLKKKTTLSIIPGIYHKLYFMKPFDLFGCIGSSMHAANLYPNNYIPTTYM